MELSIGLRQSIFRSANLSRSGCSLLLKSLERFQIPLRGIAVSTRLYQLRVDAQDFFLVSASFQRIDFCRRNLHLGLCARSLGTRICIIKSHQKLALLDGVAFL